MTIKQLILNLGTSIDLSQISAMDFIIFAVEDISIFFPTETH